MLTIHRDKLARWIQDISQNAVMLTISKPHAQALNLKLDEWHVQYMLSRIIAIANQRVFGKHKHFEFMRGLVAMEDSCFCPHFHLLLIKPNEIRFDVFKRRLSNLAQRLCDPAFELDLSCTPLHEHARKLLSKPCYEGFAKVTDTHPKTGSYLTKLYNTKYYQLTGRMFSIDQNHLRMFVSHESNKETAYA